MIEKFLMPERLEIGEIAIERHNHKFDCSLFETIDKNRDFLRKYLFWVDSTITCEDTSKTTDRFIKNWNEGIELTYVIIKHERAIGSIGFHDVDYKNHSAKAGYWLSEDENGKGYMSLCLKKLEKIMFEHDFVRLQIDCDVENEASNRVAQRNGYELEGIFAKAINAYGEFKNQNVYGKINPKYR